VVAAATRGRSDHQVTLDFVDAMRGAPAADDESALLLQACDSCADDPDADMLVSSPAGR
jgi:exonuclease SbcD